MAKRTRRADYIRGQIDNLYGPLAFLVESSDRHIKRNRAIFVAYDQYFVGSRPGEKVEKEITDAIGRANRYAELVVENNREGAKLLRSAWGWLDGDDVEYMSQFVADASQQLVEFGEKKPLPPGFYMKGIVNSYLEPPSYLRPEFVERVRRKLLEKQRALDALPAITNAGRTELPSQARRRSANRPDSRSDFGCDATVQMTGYQVDHGPPGEPIDHVGLLGEVVRTAGAPAEDRR